MSLTTDNFYRPKGPDDDFQPIPRRGSLIPKWLQTLRDRQQQATIEHKPFCFRCAKADYENHIKMKEDELLRGSNLTLQNPLDDIERYASPDLFQLKSQAREFIPQRGNPTNLLYTGDKYVYMCKKRGCMHSISVPAKKVIPAHQLEDDPEQKTKGQGTGKGK